MQISKYKAYRLLSTCRRSPAVVGLCVRANRDRGERQVQVRYHPIIWLYTSPAMLMASGTRYPYVATEVLCSEIWSIVETCVSNSNQLLGPFWETVLDRPPEDMKTQMVMASHFSKINAVFLSKKPAEVCDVPSTKSSLFKFNLSSPDVRVHTITTVHSGTTALAY